MAERICGTCSLCCKLPYVAELNKPIDTWSRHARPGNGGCSIYRDRPTSCRGFICGWLSDELKVGDEWFPTHCKMIISRAAEKGFPDNCRPCLSERVAARAILRAALSVGTAEPRENTGGPTVHRLKCRRFRGAGDQNTGLDRRAVGACVNTVGVSRAAHP
jgi:hypothetical protein